MVPRHERVDQTTPLKPGTCSKQAVLKRHCTNNLMQRLRKSSPQDDAYRYEHEGNLG